MNVLDRTKIRLDILFKPSLKQRYLDEFDKTRTCLRQVMSDCETAMADHPDLEPKEFLKTVACEFSQNLSKAVKDIIPMFLPCNAYQYMLTRLLKPEVIIETGVERGASTFCFLSALKKNGKGHLYSIDVTPRRFIYWGFERAPVVPRNFCPHVWYRDADRPPSAPADWFPVLWHQIDGISTKVLPSLLKQVGKVDIFVAGSSHLYENQLKEVELVWPYLKQACIIDRPDYETNEFRAWNEIMRTCAHDWQTILPESYADLPFKFGVILK